MSAASSPAFLSLWTLAVAAAASAFVVHLALRSKTMELGYEFGHAQQQGARLHEVKRVLEVEAASYKSPERVEIVARTLLGMEPARRIISVGAAPGDRADRSEGISVAARAGDLPLLSSPDGRRLAARSGDP